jgi:hypothetical protein
MRSNCKSILPVLMGSASNAEVDKAERSGYYPGVPHKTPSINSKDPVASKNGTREDTMSTVDSGGCDDELVISIGDLVVLSRCIGGSWEEDALACLLGAFTAGLSRRTRGTLDFQLSAAFTSCA